MKICSFVLNHRIHTGVLIDNKIVSVADMNKHMGIDFPVNLNGIIRRNMIDELRRITHNVDLKDFPGYSVSEIRFSAPYYYPSKIWGIGLNFEEHAQDLLADRPREEPASFMKPNTTIIGYGDTIKLPPHTDNVTGEAEIGVIISKECNNITVDDVQDVILGFTTILDMTAVDILQRNPRYLTRAKSFDTFFSFGPWIVTQDEIKDLLQIKISTILNGEEVRSNLVGNMTFAPYELVAFHSKSMTLKPGDIISCGTPGAVKLHPGDKLMAKVTDIGTLENPVAKASDKRHVGGVKKNIIQSPEWLE